MAEDFRDADDREILGVDNGIAAGGAHAVSTAAEEFELRAAAMQGLNELRPIHFPGSLAR